ncbi:MAG: helix-turn-helix transcriptional regulator [Bacteroidota bacterium]
MNIFDRVLDDLVIKFNRGSQQEIIKPYEFYGYSEPQNILMKVNKGNFYVGQSFTPIKPGQFYFIPASEPIYLRSGRAKDYTIFGQDGFPNYEESKKYHLRIQPGEDIENAKDVMSLLFFDVDIHSAFSLFSVMELPCIILPNDDILDFLVENIIVEQGQDKIGSKQLIRNYIYEIIIQICRFINSQDRFQNKVEKLQLTADKRLLELLKYIKENLGSDLSNEILCNIVCVAKEYVGQFFKRLTGKNLQQYIELQRLEKAHELLLTGAHNVQEVTFLVGFKDAAYFSKRFKAKYGINPINVKQTKSKDSSFFIA